jgi:hypothetical protein
MSREADAADLFARRKAGHVMRSLVANLRDASSLPYLVHHEHRPMRGVPAFICGAGPSLSASLPLLKRASEVGYVFAVNASARAVSSVVQPDVLVVRESIDVSAQLDGLRAGLVALDACASPAVWRAAESVGERGWFMAGAVQHFALCGLLGARPIYAGPSAVTAAVALAHAWGASPIVLVGCDLAFAGDGQGYAPESAWGDVRGEQLPHGLVQLGGLGHMRSVVAASGQHAPPEVQTTERFPAWGGDGEVTSLLTWGDQVRWLQTFAERRRGWFVNATGAGARVSGWDEWPVADVLEHRRDTWMERSGSHWSGWLPRVDTAPAIAALLRDAEHAIAVGGGEAAPHLGCGVLEAMSAPEILAARDEARGDAAKSIRGTWDAYAKSGQWVREVLGAV